MAKKIVIHYSPVEGAKAEWANKAGIVARYEGLKIGTLNKFLMEMRDSKDFREFVINPTHKLVWIHLKGFHEFLKWKQLIL